MKADFRKEFKDSLLKELRSEQGKSSSGNEAATNFET